MITCQKCRALLEPGTAECPYCHADQRHHRAPSESEDAEKTTRFGLWILGLILGVYVLMLLVDPAGNDGGQARLRPSGEVLVMFGAADLDLVRGCGQYWRLLASLFLHIDLLHLFFNAIALLVLIPIAAGAFGVHRTVCLYFASGLCGALLSQLNDAGGVGASGALCGLIGACAVYGRRRGGAFGRDLTSRMIRWAVVIGIFGIVMRDTIDNAGHVGGFLGGAALGYFAAGVRARGGRADRAWAFAARATVALSLLVAVLFWAPFVLRIPERRDMELYWRQAERTVRATAEAFRGGKPEDLPAAFPDGPGGTEEVRDAIREALALAREGDPETAAALERATEALADWASSLFCTHAIVPG